MPLSPLSEYSRTSVSRAERGWSQGSGKVKLSSSRAAVQGLDVVGRKRVMSPSQREVFLRKILWKGRLWVNPSSLPVLLHPVHCEGWLHWVLKAAQMAVDVSCSWGVQREARL